MTSRRCSRTLVRSVWLTLLVALVLPLISVVPAAASWRAPDRGQRSVSPGLASRLAGFGDGFADAFRRQGVDGSPEGLARPAPDGSQLDGPGFAPEPVAEQQRPQPVPVRELPELRSERSEVVENADGSRTLRAFPTPKYFETKPGQWSLIDNTVFVDRDRKGWLRNTAGAWDVRFGPLAADGSGGVELRRGDVSLRLFPEFAQIPEAGIAPTVGDVDSADTVTYRDVLPGVDLEYVVTGSGAKESIILRAPTEAAEFA